MSGILHGFVIDLKPVRSHISSPDLHCHYLEGALHRAIPSLRLFVHELRIRTIALQLLLALEVPVVQVSCPSTQVRREAQPAQVWHQSPSRDFIHLSPDIREIANDACKRDDVHSGFDGPFHPEEQRHPYQVEGELNCVECCAVLALSSIYVLV